MDHGCLTFPQACKNMPKKQPSEYLKQVYVDTLVYTPENIRHLAAVCGSDKVVIGTDQPIPWVNDSPVDPILAANLTDAEKIAILGGNACSCWAFRLRFRKLNVVQAVAAELSRQRRPDRWHGDAYRAEPGCGAGLIHGVRRPRRLRQSTDR